MNIFRLKTSATCSAILFALGLLLTAPTAYAQMGGMTPPKPAEEVSGTELEAVARVVTELQASRAQMMQKLRKKYGNPAEMDSTKMKEARMEARRMQMQSMQQALNKEDQLDRKRFMSIMMAARQDSTLDKRLRTTIQEMQKNKMKQGGPMGGNGGGQ
ncbi:DUF4168 domain-containing protein [Salisaeta longa]|uniref:DUF4168 domain-containing protein n=1 Tax=Salisaeta longa TaxID=503170 RepID=UPI0003B6CC29|nr:DUF4168 domain-containing protein [Salisaeta longa]